MLGIVMGIVGYQPRFAAILSGLGCFTFASFNAFPVQTLAILVRQPELPIVVFLPGMLTILLFANMGLRSRLKLLAELQESHDRIGSLFDAGFEGTGDIVGRQPLAVPSVGADHRPRRDRPRGCSKG